MSEEVKTKTMSMTNLKKKYSYYKRIEETKGALKPKQQKAFDLVKEQLGNDLPKERKRAKSTEDEKKAKRREYYLNHKEQIINYAKTWNKNNKDKVSGYNKKAYEKKKNMAKSNESHETTIDEIINEIVEK